MKIKKPMTVKAPAAPAPATGGATIADRFKLDAVAPAAPAVSKTATLAAFIAAFIALAASGVLVFVLYKHWKFLMPA